MSNVELTNDSKKAIAKIYREYLRRTKNGETKSQARFFDPANINHAAFIDSIRGSLDELKNAGLIKNYITGCFDFTDTGIIYMENRSADTIKEWLSIVSQFIS